jgi:hypothetical protein
VREIKYLGPGHVVVLSNGQMIERGQVAYVPDVDADYMAGSPHTWVELLGTSRGPTMPEADYGGGPVTDEREH